MNYLKKKLKPLAANLSNSATGSTANNARNKHSDRDLEDDLYDEYVVEAPPHPSELLALGVDPAQIDTNDPDKLRELYRKAKQEGKDKITNSVLLAKQRQKEEIEAKKKTHEEWKFFNSITARVEQAVKDSQKSLEHLKESSAVNKIIEPDYDLRLSADQVFKSSASVKQEHSADNWVDFSDDAVSQRTSKLDQDCQSPTAAEVSEQSEEVARQQQSLAAQQLVVGEILQDFGIDLRPKEQREAALTQSVKKTEVKTPEEPVEKLNIDLKAAARPRPRPNTTDKASDSSTTAIETHQLPNDPFDTSFISDTVNQVPHSEETRANKEHSSPISIDPFDTSYVNL